MINDIETIFNKYQNTMNKYSIPLIKISYNLLILPQFWL